MFLENAPEKQLDRRLHALASAAHELRKLGRTAEAAQCVRQMRENVVLFRLMDFYYNTPATSSARTHARMTLMNTMAQWLL